jgi:hypothetical protein
MLFNRTQPLVRSPRKTGVQSRQASLKISLDMGIGAVLEPLVVITLLVGGTYVNRNSTYKLRFWQKRRTAYSKAATEGADVEYQSESRSSLESGDSDDTLLHGDRPESPSLLAVDSISPWRERELSLWTFRMTVRTPNSRQFKDRWFSRILRKYPFMQEAFYWALIYWVCSFPSR